MRRVGTDGSIEIRCSDCGEFICRSASYPGFSTVLCVKCQEKKKILREELEKQKVQK